MTTKICVVCKKPFEAKYNWKTCSEKCSAIRDHENRRDYYFKNSVKWAWYREMAVLEQLGTSNLVSSARHNSDGTVDMKSEQTALTKELKRLGLK